MLWIWRLLHPIRYIRCLWYMFILSEKIEYSKQRHTQLEKWKKKYQEKYNAYVQRNNG